MLPHDAETRWTARGTAKAVIAVWIVALIMAIVSALGGLAVTVLGIIALVKYLWG